MTQETVAQADVQMLPEELRKEQAITVRYKNWRGESAVRTIIPVPGALRWGSTEWHPHDQWLIKVWDIERGDYREYALCDIIEFCK